MTTTSLRGTLTRASGTRFAPAWMATGICLAVALLSWFGYRAIRDSQRSSRLLIERRTSDAADLLLLALSRDMRGAQETVLLSSQWNVDMLKPPYDITTVVASAFARYPYPETFFGWRGELRGSSVVFFNRLDRAPAWVTPSATAGRFPVVVQREPSVQHTLVSAIDRNRVRGGEMSVFELRLGNAPYQFVTRLLYEDPFHEKPAGGLGFAVNMDWARRAYFPELARQVGRMGGARDGLSLAIVDESGASVGPPGATSASSPISRRVFPLLFFDPLLVALDQPSGLTVRDWTVQVGIARPDAALTAGGIADIRSLMVVAAAAGVLALGLALTSRALRAGARLADMRSEFMSTVTHELKTPLATIRAAGESVASGRVASESAVKEYAQLVVQESKRLARLVDNVLAYARITDVAEVYHFEPLDLHAVIEDALGGFAAPLSVHAFDLDVDVPAEMPPIHADRSAMRLLFDNVIDNSLRYSGTSRWLRIDAAVVGGAVAVRIHDKGIGIPPDELPQVTRRFFRGRRAGSGGSGLGLAIATRIVADHGGHLAIDSREGAGTTVTLMLPLAGHADEDAHSGR